MSSPLRHLFICCLLTVGLATCARDRDPLLLPLVTNDEFGLGARTFLELVNPTHPREGVRVESYAIIDDLYTVNEPLKRASVSGDGVGVCTLWDGKRGSGALDMRQERIDGWMTTENEQSDLHLDFSENTAYATVPMSSHSSAGVYYRGRDFGGSGTSTVLSGVLGDDLAPAYAVDASQQTWQAYTTVTGTVGGFALGLGEDNKDNSFTLIDTDVVTIPLDSDGTVTTAAGWLNIGHDRLALAYLSSIQHGASPVLYNGADSGEMATRLSGIQWCLRYDRGRWHYLAGSNNSAGSVRGHGIKPNANSLTVITNGNIALNSIYAGAACRVAATPRTTVNLAYTLHKIDVTGNGLYRSGFLGGLIEFERLSGTVDQRIWTNVLTLDARYRTGRWEVGYTGHLTVPLLEGDSESSSDNDSSERGGLTHLFSVGYTF